MREKEFHIEILANFIWSADTHEMCVSACVGVWVFASAFRIITFHINNAANKSHNDLVAIFEIMFWLMFELLRAQVFETKYHVNDKLLEDKKKKKL